MRECRVFGGISREECSVSSCYGDACECGVCEARAAYGGATLKSVNGSAGSGRNAKIPPP